MVSLEAGAGSAPFFSPPPHSELRWDIHWNHAQMRPDGSALAGVLTDVSGRIVDQGADRARFTAKSARTVREQNALELEGNVVVVGLKPEATLHCNHVSYFPDSKIYRASGNVLIDGAFGEIGPLDEVWCTADFARIGTSEEGLR